MSTTTKLTSISITSSDSNGSAALQYNSSTLVMSGVITLKYSGGTVNFNTVAEYMTFMNDLAVPILNTLNSSSGSGSGYVAATTGTAGLDKITN